MKVIKKLFTIYHIIKDKAMYIGGGYNLPNFENFFNIYIIILKFSKFSLQK